MSPLCLWGCYNQGQLQAQKEDPFPTSVALGQEDPFLGPRRSSPCGLHPFFLRPHLPWPLGGQLPSSFLLGLSVQILRTHSLVDGGPPLYSGLPVISPGNPAHLDPSSFAQTPPIHGFPFFSVPKPKPYHGLLPTLAFQLWNTARHTVGA